MSAVDDQIRRIEQQRAACERAKTDPAQCDRLTREVDEDWAAWRRRYGS